MAAYFALETPSEAEEWCIWAVEEWSLRERAASVLAALEPDDYGWLRADHRFNDAVNSLIRARPARRFIAPIEPFRLNARMALQARDIKGRALGYGDR